MRDKRQMIPAVGLLATVAIAVYMVTQLNGQGTAPTGDFTNAATAEVRDAQGQVVLRGQFVLADEEDDDVERRAALEADRSRCRCRGRGGGRILESRSGRHRKSSSPYEICRPVSCSPL